MIQFERFSLENGLRVLVIPDFNTPLVAMNVLYDVGARDEDPSKTGFAHLFEHLMFGGSVNIPRYDEPLEKVGGENNAYTTNDLTSYYLTIPRPHLETAFWLESDRMLGLAFSRKSLNVQRNVVMEEFRQTHLNQPYGDAWMLLRPLAYKVHPYRWSTIGASIDHIANARMADVRKFFSRFYHPVNAILTLAGPVETDEIKSLCEKWFLPIEPGPPNQRNLPQEPVQTEPRRMEVLRNVPQHAIYKAWHMPGRLHSAYPVADITSDILSAGHSSRLYIELVKNQQLFSEINAYITGSFDPGLLVVEGKIIPGVKPEKAEKAIDHMILQLIEEKVGDRELQKAKNRIEAMVRFADVKALERALNLSTYELLGDANMINSELSKYEQVQAQDITSFTQKYLRPDNSSTLYYLSNQQPV